MSGIPVIGKVFDKIKKNKILKAIVVAVVVYFTVGAAMEYFAASGASTAAAGGTMAATTTASTTAATAAGATGAASTGAALTAGTATTATVGAGATGAAATGVATGSTVAAGGAGIAGAGAPGIAGITTAGGAGTGLVAGEAAAAAAPSWFAANPMATMMLGQGVMGAAGSYEQEKAEKAALAQREKERTERGLFGFGYEGQPAGVVSSMMQQPTTAVEGPQVQATQAPVVAGQQVPIQRKDLPKLNQQGQLAVG